MSSFWIETESRLRFIWKQLEYALWAYENGRQLPDWTYIVEAINNNNVELAQKVIETYDLIHPDNVKPE